jgi:tripartite-type tricarboxylate transporter receptor subunit TctC
VAHTGQDRSAFGVLWSVIFLTAVGALGYSLLSGAGSVSALSSVAPQLTLWVPEAQAETQSVRVAEQSSGYWQRSAGAATVGVLPGPADQAIDAYWRRTANPVQARGSLLLLTTTTLSELAEQRDRTVQTQTSRAALVAVLATDPLELAVPVNSPITSVAQALGIEREDPTRKLFAVASNPWLVGNLAALVPGSGLRGRAPYRAYPTESAALGGVLQGDTGVLLATHSTLAGALQHHRLRLLRWTSGPQPRAWVALAAPDGVSANELRTLRHQARAVVSDPRWRALLRKDGLTPVSPGAIVPTAFLAKGTTTSRRLQQLAQRYVTGSGA